MYARLRISIYYTGTNILYAERRCPMCNFDASVPVSRDPPCYSPYPFPRIGTGENEQGGRTGEKGKEKDGGGGEGRREKKEGLWIRGNLKREKGTGLVQRARCNDCFSPPGEADAIR